MFPNLHHMLGRLLPKGESTTYNLWLRAHCFLLPPKENRNFIPHMLYENIFGRRYLCMWWEYTLRTVFIIILEYVELLLPAQISVLYSLLPDFKTPLCNRPQLQLRQLRPPPNYLAYHLLNEIWLDLTSFYPEHFLPNTILSMSCCPCHFHCWNYCLTKEEKVMAFHAISCWTRITDMAHCRYSIIYRPVIIELICS